MRCHGCYGSGKMMGGGMVQKRCDACEGSGVIDDEAQAGALANVLRNEPEIIVKKSRKRLVKEE